MGKMFLVYHSVGSEGSCVKNFMGRLLAFYFFLEVGVWAIICK